MSKKKNQDRFSAAEVVAVAAPHNSLSKIDLLRKR
jgi:hypothetical protein